MLKSGAAIQDIVWPAYSSKVAAHSGELNEKPYGLVTFREMRNGAIAAAPPQPFLSRLSA